MNCSLEETKSLKCICRPCLNKIKRGQKVVDENMKQMENSNAKAAEQYMRTCVKRELFLPAEDTETREPKRSVDEFTHPDDENLCKEQVRLDNLIYRVDY